MRRLAITGAILLGLGFLLSLITGIIGLFAAGRGLTEMPGNGRWWSPGHMMDWWDGEGGWDIDMRQAEQNLELTELGTLTVDLSILNLEIRTGSTDQPVLRYPETVSEADRDRFRVDVEVSGNNLTITESGSRNWGPFNWGSGGMSNRWRNQKVELLLPEGFAIDRMDLRLAMGEVNLADASTSDLTMHVNMGGAHLTRVQSDNALLDLDMGSLELSDAELGNARAEVAMGSIEGSLTLSGRFDVTANMGSVRLTVRNSLNDVSYDLEADMGSITVNGQDEGDSATRSAGDGTVRINAEVNMGSINLDFR